MGRSDCQLKCLGNEAVCSLRELLEMIGSKERMEKQVEDNEEYERAV